VLYLFWGANDFSVREEISKMRDSLGSPDLISLNYTEAEASSLGPGGLAGLAARVQALDGSLSVDSPSGGPTLVRVEIPAAGQEPR